MNKKAKRLELLSDQSAGKNEHVFHFPPLKSVPKEFYRFQLDNWTYDAVFHFDDKWPKTEPTKTRTVVTSRLWHPQAPPARASPLSVASSGPLKRRQEDVVVEVGAKRQAPEPADQCGVGELHDSVSFTFTTTQPDSCAPERAEGNSPQPSPSELFPLSRTPSAYFTTTSVLFGVAFIAALSCIVWVRYDVKTESLVQEQEQRFIKLYPLTWDSDPSRTDFMQQRRDAYFRGTPPECDEDTVDCTFLKLHSRIQIRNHSDTSIERLLQQGSGQRYNVVDAFTLAALRIEYHTLWRNESAFSKLLSAVADFHECRFNHTYACWRFVIFSLRDEPRLRPLLRRAYAKLLETLSTENSLAEAESYREQVFKLDIAIYGEAGLISYRIDNNLVSACLESRAPCMSDARERMERVMQWCWTTDTGHPLSCARFADTLFHLYVRANESENAVALLPHIVPYLPHMTGETRGMVNRVWNWCAEQPARGDIFGCRQIALMKVAPYESSFA